MLYGDEVGGAIVESDDGNFLTELARAAMDKVQVGDLAQMFAHANGGEVMTPVLSVMPPAMPVPLPVSSVIAPVHASVLTLDDMRRMAASIVSSERRGRSGRRAVGLGQMPLLSDEMGGSLVQLGLLDS